MRVLAPLAIALLATELGCAQTNMAIFTRGNGDVRQFILTQTLAWGGRPAATNDLPSLGSEWRFHRDEYVARIQLPRDKFSAVDAFLRHTFGTPSREPHDIPKGQRMGSYDSVVAGVSILYIVGATNTEVTILRPVTFRDMPESWQRAATSRPLAFVTNTASQQGQFSASGGGALCGLVSSAGGWPAQLSVIWGYALSPEGHIFGERQNLVYIFSGYPGGNCSDSSRSDGQFISSWSATWKTPSDTFTMSLAWDRRTEAIAAAGRRFARTNGNVFVFSVEPSGQVVCRQLHSLGPAVECSEALRHVQSLCAGDRFIASLQAEKPERR